MNRYKVAESIIAKIVADLRKRMESGDKWDVADEDIQREVTDCWEDFVIEELEKAVQQQPVSAQF